MYVTLTAPNRAQHLRHAKVKIDSWNGYVGQAGIEPATFRSSV